MLHSSKCPGPNNKLQENGVAVIAEELERTSSDYHVLVVHHHPDTLRMMAAMFRKLGYQVAAASDSTRAILHFYRIPCDLLFTDLEMPVLNGYHLARLLKKHYPLSKAVAMTCRCQAEIVDLMGDGIIDGWLFKPFKTKEIKDTLDDVGLSVAHNIC